MSSFHIHHRQRMLAISIALVSTHAVVADDAGWRDNVDHELIQMTDEFGNRVGTYNYNAETRHQGAETGFDGRIPIAGHSALEYRLAWTCSDLTFRGGEFSGNQIAGVPKHLLSAELMWRSGGWRFGPNVRWLPRDTPTDHANTREIYQDRYALLGFRSDYTANDGRWPVFLYADNLTDRRYASSYAIRNRATLAEPGFLPGATAASASPGASDFLPIEQQDP